MAVAGSAAWGGHGRRVRVCGGGRGRDGAHLAAAHHRRGRGRLVGSARERLGEERVERVARRRRGVHRGGGVLRCSLGGGAVARARAEHGQQPAVRRQNSLVHAVGSGGVRVGGRKALGERARRVLLGGGGGDAASAGTGEVAATAARACSVASLFSLASLRAAAAPVTERVLFLFATDRGLCLNADPSDPSDPSEPRDAPAELRCAAAPGPAESRRGARVGVNLSRAGARVPPASAPRSSAVAPFTPPPGVNTGGSPRLSIAWGAMPAASGPPGRGACHRPSAATRRGSRSRREEAKTARTRRRSRRAW